MKDTIQEYVEALHKHDWTYEYSDDHRVWEEGNKKKKELNRMFDQLLEEGYNRRELVDMWNEAAPPYHQFQKSIK